MAKQSIITPLDERRLWDEREAAYYCNVTGPTFARWRKKGFIVGLIMPGGTIRYRPEDVKALAEARQGTR